MFWQIKDKPVHFFPLIFLKFVGSFHFQVKDSVVNGCFNLFITKGPNVIFLEVSKGKQFIDFIKLVMF